MIQASRWERFGRHLSITPRIAIAAAIALIVTGVGLGLYNEHLSRTERIRQVNVQAEILAGSVAAPLAFGDDQSTREYVNALKANPQVEAAAAYDERGRLAAGFVRDGAPAPRSHRMASPVFDAGRLIVSRQVSQSGAKLGSVYLRVVVESLPRRAMRYLGIGLLMIMASLLVAVLGASHASLSEAHRKLQDETRERENAEHTPPPSPARRQSRS